MKSHLAKDYLKLAATAAISRIAFLLIAKYSSLQHQPFDKSTQIYETKSPFNFLNSWDSVHFYNIAENGYTAEHLLPFFPLLPLISNLLNFYDSLVTGVFINNISFIISVLILYKISIQYFSRRTSIISCLFYIFNPASIIYSSLYCESLFALVFLIGFFYSVNNRMLKSSILFSLSCLLRSNGIVFILFLKTLYFPIVLLPFCLFQLHSLLLIWKAKCSFKLFVPYSYVQKHYFNQGFLNFLTPNNIPNIIIGLPVILFSLFILQVFYADHLSLNENNLKESQKSECTLEDCGDDKCDENAKDFYEHLKDQEKSKKEQIIYCSKNDEKNRNSKFHSATDKKNKIVMIIQRLMLLKDIVLAKLFSKSFLSDPFSADPKNNVLKLSLILTFQVLVLVFFIHWNIAMRFISYNPFIYWSSALLSQKHFNSSSCKIFIGFFSIYGILYAVMFGCFYPPA